MKTNESYEEKDIIKLFTKEDVKNFSIVNSSRGNEDFREAIFVTTLSNQKLVIKLADNLFTNEKSIEMWQRTIDEYNKLGYYCPRILTALDKSFPRVNYKNHNCITYAEEFSKYETAHNNDRCKPYLDKVYLMTARVANKQFNYTDIPSGYTLFTPFLGDEMDEVRENAEDFYEFSKNLPDKLKKQCERIYRRWMENRRELHEIYFDLPFSVFQADLNDSNILIDEKGEFVGLIDFNLAGKDQFLNYLFREIFKGNFEEELNEILRALSVVKLEYKFSKEEIKAAPLIYRCIKPLFFTRTYEVKSRQKNPEKLEEFLNEIEYYQTKDIDFKSYMI